MGAKTGISWTSATWNPIRGCRRTAPAGSKQSGCGDPTGGGCYAERQAYRFSGPGQPYEGLVHLTAKGPRWTGKTRFVGRHLLDPVRWSTPKRIFTDSMSDLFYDGFRDDEIDRVVAVMMICAMRDGANHTFQTLTKRPERMRAYFDDDETQERVARAAGALMEDGDGWFDLIAFRKEGLVHPLLWWGVSVENQAAADERIPLLLATRAAVRFLSIEPLLGPVDLSAWTDPCAIPCGEDRWPDLSWVICGAESGPGARSCSEAWLRHIRDQCANEGIPFFLKQAFQSDAPIPAISCGEGSERKGASKTLIDLPYLDGVQHAAFPEVNDAG